MFYITLIRCSHGKPYELRCDQCVEEGVEREIARAKLEQAEQEKKKDSDKSKPVS